MREEKGRPVDILLVEDSPTDALLAREAMDASPFPHRLHVVPDGVEALAFLRRQGKFAACPRPGLVLLDLNLPRKDGREVLAEIKTDDGLKSIPVLVLTTSRSEADVQRAYQLHANCYLVKPVDFEKFAEAMRCIEAFWLAVATLPGGA